MDARIKVTHKAWYFLRPLKKDFGEDVYETLCGGINYEEIPRIGEAARNMGIDTPEYKYVVDKVGVTIPARIAFEYVDFVVTRADLTINQYFETIARLYRSNQEIKNLLAGAVTIKSWPWEEIDWYELGNVYEIRSDMVRTSMYDGEIEDQLPPKNKRWVGNMESLAPDASELSGGGPTEQAPPTPIEKLVNWEHLLYLASSGKDFELGMEMGKISYDDRHRLVENLTKLSGAFERSLG